MESKYVKPLEVADEFEVSVSTVKNWMRSEQIPAFKVGGQWKIPRDEYIVWKEYLEHKTDS